MLFTVVFACLVRWVKDVLAERLGSDFPRPVKIAGEFLFAVVTHHSHIFPGQGGWSFFSFFCHHDERLLADQDDVHENSKEQATRQKSHQFCINFAQGCVHDKASKNNCQ